MPAAATSGWLARVERELAAREYEATVSRRGLQAPNRAQNLRTYFEPTGVRVVDRTAPGEPGLVSLRLSAMGRGDALCEMAPAHVSHATARVELARDGVTEWYENSPAGLEQGFTLRSRPAGDGPLVLELRVDGASVSGSGAGVALACMGAGARRLDYGRVSAVDARGTALAAHLEPCEGGLRIVASDADAAYPITIDPLLTGVSDGRLSESQASAQFGRRVASAGDVNGDGYGDVAVGTEFYDAGEANEGAVFVFLGGPNGIATGAAHAALIQSNQGGASMGPVAAGDFNGDGYSDLIVGAYNYTNGQTVEGAAFVFLGSPTGIHDGTPANASAILESNSVGAVFGVDVQCAGDVNGDGYDDVIIGAESYNGTGAAFIFRGSATGIASGNPATAATALVCSQASASFGRSVAGAGDVNGDGFADVIVGAYRYDSGETNEGAAFVWFGSASGIPSGSQATANAMLQENIAGSNFGDCVAGLGDVNGDGYADVAVGAQFFSNGETNEGAVWLFLGTPSGIVTNQFAANRIESDQANSGMGSWNTIAAAGDVNGDGYADIIVGAPQYDDPTTNEGAAFVFLGCATGFLTTTPGAAFARLELDQASAGVGSSVAGAGDINGDGYADVIVGAPVFDGATTDEGAAAIYLGGARALTSGSQLGARATIQSNQAGARLGTCVASAGDVNADGYDDVIVGAPGYDLGQTDEGAAFVFLSGPFGFPGGSPATAAATLQGNQLSASFGYAVAGAGDVNGDGYADVIVGAPGADKAYVFQGGPTGVASGDPSTAATTLSSDQAADFMGTSVAGAGDVNGDGYADVIVGADYYVAQGANGGAGGAFIYHGGPNGIASGDPTTAATRLVAGLAGGNFGLCVAGAGDVNGDGYADVIIGAPFYNLGEANEGAAFIYLGGPGGVADGVPGSAATTIQSNQVGAHLGISVAGAGDMNGDGFADVIVGADQFGTNDQGAAWAFFGTSTGISNRTPLTASMIFSRNSDNAHQGRSVAGVGDVNGDGFADVMVGSPDISGVGSADLYLGTPTPSPAPAPLYSAIISNQSNPQLGFSVAGAGDVDGDGFADVVIGAPFYDSGETDEGAAFYFNGGGGLFGRQTPIRQLRGNGSAVAVQPWGSSNAADNFQVAMHAVDPSGRGRVKLEIEHCPCGVPLGSAGCTRTVSPTWTDAGASSFGVDLSHTAAGVASGLRRWRVRTLTAAFNVTQPGISAPPHPAHGPWRRLQAQLIEGDVRVAAGIVGVEVRHDGASFAIERLVNPARGRIEFTVTLPDDAPAKAELFDVAGRRWLARDLPRHAARTELRWDEGRLLHPGMYMLRITQGVREATARVTVLN